MKPIIFNTEMVRAILDVRKTAMRQVIKPQPKGAHMVLDYDKQGCHMLCGGIATTGVLCDWEKYISFPYSMGDILYVQEEYFDYKGHLHYKADGKHIGLEKNGIYFKWDSPVSMPKEAARIFLRVTDMYIERLQDIAETDAIKEGFEPIVCNHPNGLPCTDCLNTGYLEPAMASFYTMWEDDINEADRKIYGWDANPWVWVIEFEIISKEDMENETNR